MALVMVVRGVFAVRRQRVRDEFGRVLLGKRAVVRGRIFVALGLFIAIVGTVAVLT